MVLSGDSGTADIIGVPRPSGAGYDIGAYEFGDTLYWIPGRKSIQASSPVPANLGTTHFEFVDLMWLEGYRSLSSDIYFGLSQDAVESADHGTPEFKGNQFSNIFQPGPLAFGQNYYWRIDAVGKDSIVKGEVWSFIPGVDANPDIYTITFRVFEEKEGVVAHLDCVDISSGNQHVQTDSSGEARLEWIPGGPLQYSLVHPGFFSVTDSVWVGRDTLLEVRLFSRHADIRFEVNDSEGPLEGAMVELDGTLLLYTKSDGTAIFDKQNAREQHTFSLERSGYEDMAGSLFLEADTVVSITLLKSTGLETERSSGFILYPNPASNHLYLKSPGMPCDYSITSPEGKVVMNGKISGEKHRIDLKGVPAGIYLIRVFTDINVFISKIVIK